MRATCEEEPEVAEGREEGGEAKPDSATASLTLAELGAPDRPGMLVFLERG